MLEPSGVLLINKSVGMSSYDVIRKLKPFFPRKYKIGHAGTLDPFAEGLLIILIGKGTKLMNRFLSLSKRYTFKAEFGYETDTQDITGTVLNSDEKKIKKDVLEVVLQSFVGKYKQLPPIYSAKKVDGIPAYKLARKGESPKLTPKEVEISEIDMLSFEYPEFTISARVSSGTYIRTLVVDIAHKLQTYATTKTLRRDSIGSFLLEKAIEVEGLSEDKIIKNLISLEDANGELGE